MASGLSAGPGKLPGIGPYTVYVDVDTAGAVGPDGTPLTFADVQPAIEAALAEWNAVEHSAPTFNLPVLPHAGEEPGPGISVIRFAAHWSNGAGYARPHKDPVTDQFEWFELWLNHLVRWSVTDVHQEGELYDDPLTYSGADSCGRIGAIDLQSLLAHELGHVVGLGHPTEANDAALTMNQPDYEACGQGTGWWTHTDRRTLEAGDKLGKVFTTPDLGRLATQQTLPHLFVGSPPTVEVGRDFTMGTGQALTAEVPVEVASGATFTAGPVSQVAFVPTADFRVEGALVADGATFTESVPDGGWGGLIVADPGGLAPTASLTNSTVEAVRYDGLEAGAAAVSVYDASVWLTDTDLLDSEGANVAGVWAAGPDAYVEITSATSGSESEIRGHTGHGVAAVSGAEVVIDEGTVIEENGRSGVYASSGGRAVVENSSVLENGHYGIEAFDYGEVAFEDTGAPSRGSAYEPNTVASNTRGAVYAREHASVSAGTYNDLTGACAGCANTITDHSTDGAPVDVKAEVGSVVFAESDFWGNGITSEGDLVLVETGGSVVEVTPLLTSPPSAGGSPVFARGGGADPAGRSGGARAVLLEAREAAAEGDYTRAFVLLRGVIEAGGDGGLRRLAYTEATRLLREAQPPNVVAFLEGVAGGSSAYRPWALRSLVVAYAAGGHPGEAEAAAALLAAEPGEGHARFGTLARFRLRLAAGDLTG
ncbi:MAG: right-handed parallel beta-helix repeat-containing protein, partial [Rhodothermales bacterium]|nr:right-handed parallel beta-helix repeat-containing protein [Rhodothermales bacterium]